MNKSLEELAEHLLNNPPYWAGKIKVSNFSMSRIDCYLILNNNVKPIQGDYAPYSYHIENDNGYKLSIRKNKRAYFMFETRVIRRLKYMGIKKPCRIYLELKHS